MTLQDITVHMLSHRHMHLRYNNKKTIESLHTFVHWSEDSHGMKRVCSWRQRVTEADVYVCVYSPSSGVPVCRLQKLEFLQWHPSVGQFQLSFSSGVPVYPANIRWYAQWYPNVQPVVFQWHSSVHWTSQCRLAQGKGCHHCFTSDDGPTT